MFVPKTYWGEVMLTAIPHQQVTHSYLK